MSWNEGRRAEAAFGRCFRLLRKASVLEDRNLHFDGIYLINGEELAVDIKAHRRTNRGEDPGEMAWVEMVNVSGKRGWLFGQADIIAFEYFEGWMLVYREILLDMVLTNLIPEIAKAPFCMYRRNNRKDLIVMVPYSELKKISIT